MQPHALVGTGGAPARLHSNLLPPPPPPVALNLACEQGDAGMQMLLGAAELLSLNYDPCAAAAGPWVPYSSYPGNTAYLPVCHDTVVPLSDGVDDPQPTAAATSALLASRGGPIKCDWLQQLPAAAATGIAGSAASAGTGMCWGEPPAAGRDLPASSSASAASTAATLLSVWGALRSISLRPTDLASSWPAGGGQHSSGMPEPAASLDTASNLTQAACPCTSNTSSGSDGSSASACAAAANLGGLAAAAVAGLQLGPAPQQQQHAQQVQAEEGPPDAAPPPQPATSRGSSGSRGSGRSPAECGAGLGPRGGVQKKQRQEAAGAPMARKYWECELTIEILEEHGCFDMTQARAARHLGFSSPTTLKKAMSRLGIKQWPNRKRSTVRGMIAGLECYLPQYSGPPARVAAVLEGVRREMAPFLRSHTGSIDLPQEVTAWRQVVYKLKNEEKDTEKKEKMRPEVERLMQTLEERFAPSWGS